MMLVWEKLRDGPKNPSVWMKCLNLSIHSISMSFQRSFQYYGAHAWNMLPAHMKAAQSLSVFKSLIKWGLTCSCYIYIALLQEISPYILITGDGFVFSCGIVTVTTFLFSVFKNSRMSLRRRFWHFGGVFLAGFTGGCLDNLQCVRWRELRLGDHVFVSVNNHQVFDEIAYILIA